MAEEAKPATAATGEASKGEVKKIGQDAGKLTINHGAPNNVCMPAMTRMVGRSDNVALGKVRTGDQTI